MNLEFNAEHYPDLPGIDLDLDLEEGEDYRISISVTRDQIEAISGEYDIDVEAMLRSAIIQEGAQQVSKDIAVTGFNKQEPTQIEFDELEKVFEDSSAKFSICGPVIAAQLSDYPAYSYTKLNNFAGHGGRLYKTGMLYGVDVYVDPFMLWADTRIALMENNYLNFKITVDDKMQFSSVTPMAPKTIAVVRMVKGTPISKVYNINNLKI